MVLALFGIFASLVLLIGLAYRGHSVIAVAPIAALVAVLLSGAPLLASYTQIFMPALGGFIVTFFPLFLTGAIFGKLMSVSGYAQNIADSISRLFGPKRAILVTVLITALLTYGGVSAWVVVFTIFPIGKSLFEAADIPRRLMPAAIALGIFTFATAALPGSPQIHNAIPTRFFETTTFAAPLLGVIGAIVTFTLGMLWLNWRQGQLARAGESFSDMTHAEKTEVRLREKELVGANLVSADHSPNRYDPLKSSETMGRGRLSEGSPRFETARAGSATHGFLGLLPILVVVLVNALFVYVLVPSFNFDYLSTELFGSTVIASVVGVWSVTTAMATSIAVIFLMRPKNFRTYVESLTKGAKDAVLPVFTTASEVGYGAVIASLAVFVVIRDGIFGVSENALVVSSISTAVISGITGSSSGGLSITLGTFGAQLQSMAIDQGISMEAMHRVMAMSSVSFDSLPHNGAIITLLLVCGLTHRESYKDIGVVTVLVPLIGVLVVLGLALAIGAF
ncbi:putative H+/gluconate symporter family protein [Arthrobacter sp. PAMC 25486]|uniref:GntP family permease n=1 Tax=Arthrobacter sp. PAMC 25486 TaxID=1494608 RepID=UPI000535B440|nr:GntP family permease [Arthrobacter sp. PAMC 25486]AIY03048.1 putative H+/gluconate symporter family protein [Arthrobacter sp. PAMC 25486]